MPYVYNSATAPGLVDRTFDLYSGKIELDFKPHQGLLVYGSVNRGRRAGAGRPRVSFDAWAKNVALVRGHRVAVLREVGGDEMQTLLFLKNIVIASGLAVLAERGRRHRVLTRAQVAEGRARLRRQAR